MTFSSPVLSLELNDHVATLWLDRPEKLNAMGQELIEDLPRAMAVVAESTDVRTVIIAARGNSFSVGIDLAGFSLSASDHSADDSGATASLQQIKRTTDFQTAITSVAACPVPVIAAIHSYCIGAGMDLVTACDVRLSSRDAIFSVRETKIGIVADVGTLQRLPGIVADGHVAELAFTGKDIDAARARDIGLVNDVFDDAGAVYAAALEMAEEIARNPPLAVRGTKFMLQQSENLTTEQSLLLNGLWTMATTLNSNDLKEAMRAFTEKRMPKFSGT